MENSQQWSVEIWNLHNGMLPRSLMSTQYQAMTNFQNRYQWEIKAARWDYVTCRGEVSLPDLSHLSEQHMRSVKRWMEEEHVQQAMGRLVTDGKNMSPSQWPTEVISVRHEAELMKMGMKTSYGKPQSFLNLRYLNKEKLQQWDNIFPCCFSEGQKIVGPTLYVDLWHVGWKSDPIVLSWPRYDSDREMSEWWD